MSSFDSPRFTPPSGHSLPTHLQSQYAQGFWRSKTVWIVGASEGLGAQLGHDVLALGAQLWVSARGGARLEEQFANTSVVKLPLDVSDPDAVGSCIQRFERLPDVVIFCAAIYEPGTIDEVGLDSLLQHTRVNYLGGVILTKCLLQRRGELLRANSTQVSQLHVCLVGSVAGYRGMKRAIAYNPNKAALKSFTECLALDTQHQRPAIHVSIAEPGFVRTRLTDKNDFKMPFLLTPAQASAKILTGIGAQRFEVRFPAPMVWTLKLLAALPFGLYRKLWK